VNHILRNDSFRDKPNVKELEIIIIDDGSTDGTGGFQIDWLNSIQEIHVIHQCNGGLSLPETRVRTLQLANGLHFR
jgi:glycosyltransferase involved in cell wall biosynthesis